MLLHLTQKFILKKMYKILKKIFIISSLAVIVFSIFVLVTNRNSKNMTVKQKFLKTVYPVFMWFSGKDNNAVLHLTKENSVPSTSFYSLKDTLSNGMVFDFALLKGKKVMLVNTASDCGYTNQYADLQKLYELNKDKLVVIGFPANNFKEQEKGSDEEIAAFCKNNFSISFPLMKKSSVLKNENQSAVFNWLTEPAKNGWNNKQPSWNFCKYLVDENGNLTDFFGPAIEPLGKEITKAINR